MSMNLVQAMDSIQRGENGHNEYSWSSQEIQEYLVKLYFQLVRTDDMRDLEHQIEKLLDQMFVSPKENNKEIVMFCKMIANVRDVDGNGKGEVSLSHMMLWCLYKRHRNLATFLFEKFVSIPETHQYGSWKDVKYFCNYIKEKTGQEDHYFINYIVRLTNYYLKLESKITDDTKLTLISKWIPREKSKRFNWLFCLLARDYFSVYFKTAKDTNSRKKALSKSYREYRKLLTSLNKRINTVQVKMCDSRWTEIRPNEITSKTMSKQMMALLNQKRVGTKVIERSTSEDRRGCANTLKSHLEDVKNKKDGKKVNGKRCDVYEFVRDTFKFLRYGDDCKTQLEMIEAQWEHNKTRNVQQTTKIIPLCDTSGSMECDECVPLYNALGLSIRLSEITHPAFKDRILTFSAEPEWVNLSEEKTLSEKLVKLKSARWGMNTNLYGAMKMILDTLIINEVHPNEVDNLVLAIFSDMQIDQAYTDNRKVLQDKLKQMFALAGLETKYRQPYPVPHILYWNLRKTSGFPTKTTEPNVTMFSGYNSSLLNVFSEKGMEDLVKITPWDMLKTTLNNSRYECMDKWIDLI